MNKETLKKIYALLVGMVYIIAAFGAAGYLIYFNQYVIAFASLCQSAMAFPYAYKIVKPLFS